MRWSGPGTTRRSCARRGRRRVMATCWPWSRRIKRGERTRNSFERDLSSQTRLAVWDIRFLWGTALFSLPWSHIHTLHPLLPFDHVRSDRAREWHFFFGYHVLSFKMAYWHLVFRSLRRPIGPGRRFYIMVGPPSIIVPHTPIAEMLPLSASFPKCDCSCSCPCPCLLSTVRLQNSKLPYL